MLFSEDNRGRSAAAIPLLLLLLFVVIWRARQDREQTSMQTTYVKEAPVTAEAINAVRWPDHLEGIYQSANPMRDLEMVYNLMESYRLLVKDPDNPYPRGGSNEDIVRAMSGKNRYGEVLLAKTHPALSDGLLLDRWGTPLHFHYQAGDQVEIRSAGPDGKLGSSDDYCWEM